MASLRSSDENTTWFLFTSAATLLPSFFNISAFSIVSFWVYWLYGMFISFNWLMAVGVSTCTSMRVLISIAPFSGYTICLVSSSNTMALSLAAALAVSDVL